MNNPNNQREAVFQSSHKKPIHNAEQPKQE